MAVKDINDKGGVNGHPLEMLVLDTQAKPEIAINAANKLIEVDKVPLIITAWSSVVKAVAPIGNRTKTLELNMGANSPDIANLGDYVYTVFPLAEVDVTALAKYTTEKLGKKRAAVLYINNDTGIGGAKIYRDVFTAAGGEVVAFEGYDPKATDFTGVLLKARVGNPDVVHIHGLSELPQVIAQMRQLGMQQQITSYSAGYNPKLLSQLGPAAEGLIVTSLAPTSAANPNVAKLLELWKQVGRFPERAAVSAVCVGFHHRRGADLRLGGQERPAADRRELPQGAAGDPRIRPADDRQAGHQGRPSDRQAGLSVCGEGQQVRPATITVAWAMTDPVILLQILWTGIAMSSYFVLFTVAFALTLKVEKLWNFAQAGLMGIAFYAMFYTLNAAHWPAVARRRRGGGAHRRGVRRRRGVGDRGAAAAAFQRADLLHLHADLLAARRLRAYPDVRHRAGDDLSQRDVAGADRRRRRGERLGFAGGRRDLGAARGAVSG